MDGVSVVWQEVTARKNTRKDDAPPSQDHPTEEKKVTMVTNEDNSNNTTTYNTARTEKISLMVLPAFIAKRAKKLKAMLCWTPAPLGHT